MAGIYLHIPFCRKACHYCNFHFSTSLHHKPALIAAMVQEIAHRHWPDGVKPEKDIQTLYFGGGTPSLLSAHELDLLLNTLHKHFNLAPAAEITLEANPDNITAENLAHWRQIGINRLSIGIQSFFEEDLVWMNRAHNAAQAEACIHRAREAGFSNFSIDLIYGTPNLTDPRWAHNLEKAIALQAPHISAYALTVEEKTALHHFVQKGRVKAPDEEAQAAQFDMLSHTLTAAGYDHYEISNFALPGMHSRHNSAYWSGVPYYGFGPGAHAFDGRLTRWWNVPNNALYIQRSANGEPLWECERLSEVQRLNERLMTGLRSAAGIRIDSDNQVVEDYRLTATQWHDFRQTLDTFIQQGLIRFQAGCATLTRQGKFLGDGIAADLFVEEASRASGGLGNL